MVNHAPSSGLQQLAADDMGKENVQPHEAHRQDKDEENKVVVETPDVPPSALPSNQAQGSVSSRHELDDQQGAAKRMRLEVPELQQEPELISNSIADQPRDGDQDGPVLYFDQDGSMKEAAPVVLTEDAVHHKLHAHMGLLRSVEPLKAPTVNALIKMAADELGVHFTPLSFGNLATSNEDRRKARAMELLTEEDERRPNARLYVLALFFTATTAMVVGEDYTLAWYRQGEKKTHYIDALRRSLDEGSATYKALDLWARHVSKGQEPDIVHDGANFPLQTDTWDSGLHVVLNARRVIYGSVRMRPKELRWYTSKGLNTLSAPERSQKFLAIRREFWHSIVLNIQGTNSADARASTSAQPARAVRQPGQMDHRAVLEDEDSDDEE